MTAKNHPHEAALIPAERRQQILNLLTQREIITINELTTALKVSHMTIRRDLQKMEEDGLLTQVTGGAQLSKRILSEPSHLQKETLNAAQKDAIGRAAAAMIPPHACIYLDAGTTSLALCRHLGDRDDLTIVSNDFEVINYLIKHSSSTLIHTGGQVQKQNRSGIGTLAAQTILSLSIDIGFISASSWELRGITTPDSGKVPVKQAVVKASRQRILICDSSKYSQTATYLAVPLNELNGIITDRALSDHAQKMIARMDLKLHLV